MASLCLINHARVQDGLQPVRVDARLQAAADGHARDEMARSFFAHVNPDGCDTNCRAGAAGYPGPAGENLAKDHRSAEEVVAAWLLSPAHRRNVLAPQYRTVGSGTAVGGPYESHWVHNFGLVAAPPTAVSGLEPRFQGAADPSAGAPVDQAGYVPPEQGGPVPPDPVGTVPSVPRSAVPAAGSREDRARPKLAPRLRVRRARVSAGGRLQIVAATTRRAGGGRVSVTLRSRDGYWTFGTTVRAGEIRTTRPVPRILRGFRRAILRVRYEGNPRVRSDEVRRLLRR